MVSSRLYPDITYVDTDIIDPNDIGYDAVQIEIELFPGVGGIVALGGIRTQYSDRDLVFIPVYIVSDGKTICQIGVYEFKATEYTGILDVNKDIDIDKIAQPLPLYYSFFNEGYMKTLLGDKIIKIPCASVSTTSLIKSMNREMSERSQYKSNRSSHWIQKFMKNNNYSLQDNKPNGDCFFAVIRDAMSGNKNKKTVGDLRNIVSEAATQVDFENYKEHYDQYNNEIVGLRATDLKIKDDMTLLKKKNKTVKDRNERKELSIQGRALETRYGNMVREKENVNELMAEFKWMEGVTDLEKFKTKIQKYKS